MTSDEFIKHLRSFKKINHKIFVAFLTAGARVDWIDIGKMLFDQGVDILEIGIPFSDPMIDGPVIQKANKIALDNNILPFGAISNSKELAEIGPTIVMTYYNIVFRSGLKRFGSWLKESFIVGSIIADLAFEESFDWRHISKDLNLANVLLVAPTTTDERLKMICEASDGFIYLVSVMGVTGERQRLQSSVYELSNRVKMLTEKPRLIGIGISNEQQAINACEMADGFIIGSAIMRRVLEGQSIRDIAKFIRSLRQATL